MHVKLLNEKNLLQVGLEPVSPQLCYHLHYYYCYVKCGVEKLESGKFITTVPFRNF